MKYLAFILSLFFFTSINAQDCGYIENLDQGDNWTMTNYNAKGKEESSIKYTVLNKEEGDTLNVELNTIVTTKKEEHEATYLMQCYQGSIFLNMEHLLGSMTSKMEGMEMEIEADQLVMPANLTVGDSLPEATISIAAGMNGMTIMNITVTIKDRVVSGIQSVTTPAGTFECYVIEQTTEVSFGGRARAITSKDFFSITSGTIRSENYNKKGKLEDYSEITELSI